MDAAYEWRVLDAECGITGGCPICNKHKYTAIFYEQDLADPWSQNEGLIEIKDQKVVEQIKEDLNIIPDDLKEQITYENENGDIVQSPFTKENAVRVYMWDQKGMEIPNLKEENKKIMLNEILENPELRLFAQELSRLNTGEDTKPKNNWAGGTITTDLIRMTFKSLVKASQGPKPKGTNLKHYNEFNDFKYFLYGHSICSECLDYEKTFRDNYFNYPNHNRYTSQTTC